MAELPFGLPAPAEPWERHARHVYAGLVDPDQLATDRDDVIVALHRQRIGTGVHYRAVHRHRFCRERFGYEPDDFPVANRISDQTLSLPLGPSLSDAEVDDVIAAARRTADHFALRR